MASCSLVSNRFMEGSKMSIRRRSWSTARVETAVNSVFMKFVIDCKRALIPSATVERQVAGEEFERNFRVQI